MIRIAYISRGMYPGGGASRIALSIIRGLDRERFEPYLILFQRKQPELDLAGVTVLPPQCAPGAKLWWQEIGFARGVAREVKRRGIRIVHSHDGANSHDRLALWLARSSGAKVVRTQHAEVSARRSRLGLLARCSDQLTDAWTAVSPDIVEGMVQYARATPGKVVVTPNGLDLARFESPKVARCEMRRTLSVREDATIMLAVGRLGQQKDYPTMVDAFALASRELESATLMIAGEGSQRELVEQRVRACGLEGRVRLLGRRDDVPELLGAADVFVISSLYEGMPGAPMEAMAAGLPVIGTDVPGTRYVLEGGKAGVMVPPRSPERMAEAMVRLGRDAALRREVAARGRRRAVENFSEEAMVRRYEEIYERLVGEGARPKPTSAAREDAVALSAR